MREIRREKERNGEGMQRGCKGEAQREEGEEEEGGEGGRYYFPYNYFSLSFIIL